MNRANGAGGATSMPVARYFLFVGGVLLALLFALDAFAPQQAAVASNAASPSIDKTVVRIRSDQKLPERVVYDTSLPTIVPPAAKTQVAAAPPAPVADTTAQARVRDTFAQFVPAEAKKLEQRRRLRASARLPRPAGPRRCALPSSSALRLFRRTYLEQHLVSFARHSRGAARSGSPVRTSAAASGSCRQNRCSRSAARPLPSGNGNH